MTTNPIIWLTPSEEMRKMIRARMERAVRYMDSLRFSYDALLYRHSNGRDNIIVATHEPDTEDTMNYIYSKLSPTLPLVDLMSDSDKSGNPVQYDKTKHIDYIFRFNQGQLNQGSGVKILAYMFAKES